MGSAAANRGRSLEQLIDFGNDLYRRTGRAVVHKIPTAWTPLRNGFGKIVSAKVDEKAIVDFLGCIQGGRTVAFDAKQNHTATRFQFDDRWAHEVEFIRDVIRCGGVGFILIEQVSQARVYLVPGAELLRLWDEGRKGGRRSIPLSTLETFPVVRSAPGVPVDWLSTLEEAFL